MATRVLQTLLAVVLQNRGATALASTGWGHCSTTYPSCRLTDVSTVQAKAKTKQHTQQLQQRVWGNAKHLLVFVLVQACSIHAMHGMKKHILQPQ
jgi:hypothetical protein